ncbi:MAG: hypothetical protein LBL17_02965 [Coxiellaceae bacterium]|jgi:hypothetical protein|nr:hypothetical protein [Coxiellaceae bacterium]
MILNIFSKTQKPKLFLPPQSLKKIIYQAALAITPAPKVILLDSRNSEQTLVDEG